VLEDDLVADELFVVPAEVDVELDDAVDVEVLGDVVDVVDVVELVVLVVGLVVVVVELLFFGFVN
jgi:hypothetical protein